MISYNMNPVRIDLRSQRDTECPMQKIPSKIEKKFSWQIQYEENLTGTNRAHRPEGSLTSDFKKNMKKYETWKS